MTFSKANPSIYKFAAWGLASLMLGACIKNKPIDSGAGHATFKVASIGGSSQHVKLNADWDIPARAIFNFNVCLRDVAKNEIIIGQQFVVESEEHERRTAVTDSAGCLNWAETFAFNMGKTPTYIKILRTVTAAGIHRGALAVSLAINPWSKVNGDEEPIVDLETRKTEVAAIVEGSLPKNLGLQPTQPDEFNIPLSVGSVQLTILERGQKGNYLNNKLPVNVHLHFAPQFLLKNMLGDTVPLPITKGKFHVTFYLINKSRDGVASTMTKDESGEKIFNIHDENIDADFAVDTLVPQDGQMELGLHVRPEGLALNVSEFNGVFQIGSSGRNWLGQNSAAPIPDALKGSNLQNYSNVTAKADPGQVAVNPYFRIVSTNWTYLGVNPTIRETPMYRVLTGSLRIGLIQSATDSNVPDGREYTVKINSVEGGGRVASKSDTKAQSGFVSVALDVESFVYHKDRQRLYQITVIDKKSQATSGACLPGLGTAL